MQPTERTQRNFLRRALCAATLALSACAALAQTAGVVRWPGGDLYSDANSGSRSLAKVERGEKVEYIASDGLWRKVRYKGQEGWMNRLVIEWQDAPAAAPAAAAPATPMPVPPAAPAQALMAPPPPGSGAPARLAQAPAPAAVAMAAAAVPRPVAVAAPAGPVAGPARGHAIVFGIAHYEPRLQYPSLDGVENDMSSASAMAQLMGITANRVTVYRDADVTSASMASILTQLSKDISEGEPVLLYYSGHGGRTTDPTRAGRCIEGLTMYDGQLMTNTAMAELLRPLARITDQLFVFFDSCHSGGLSSTRAVGPQVFKPKFVARGDVSNCDEIVNMLSSPPPGTRATGNKYIYIGAARANEVSLDTANGGLATTNLLSCMVQGGGPGQTVEALRACAQEGVNQALAGNATYKPPNITITGDLGMVPVRADLSVPRREQIVTQARNAVPGAGAASKSVQVNSALLAKGWKAVYNPQQAFAGVASHADAGVPLAVQTPNTLKIDTEALRMNVRSPGDGYLYVFQATSDGKNAVLLFPNVLDRDNRVKAGQSLDLPRASWPLVAGGPEGESQLLLVYSKAERDIGQLVGQEMGPFLDLAVSPVGMQALALAVSRSAYASEPECAAAPGAPAYCAASYSATVKTIREVR